jgi:surfeit locus 1 family protein
MAALLAVAIAAVGLCAALVALGNWQIARRAWKLDLMERVAQRVHAPPTAAPGPEQWPQLSAAHDEYRRVRVSGRFLHERETLVQAATELGAGYWVLTPLEMADGALVLVNRGFVAPEGRDRAGRAARTPQAPGSALPDRVTVTGLLRMTEPGGTLLRHNDALAERWVSRDVQAIAAARGLTGVAPYFIDAEAEPSAPDGPAAPVGGLTVIAFHNDHLLYAITWYALALLLAVATAIVVRRELRARPGARP